MEEEQQQLQYLNNRTRPNILVTGTPGVGKTTFSKLLSDYVQLPYHNVGESIHSHKLYTEWDHKYDVPVFDDDKVVDFFETVQQNEGNIFDFHSSAMFPLRWFDLVILLRCNNTQLYDRLNQRGYSQHKIDENIQCEIMEVTSDEVYESYPKQIVLELRNEEQTDMQKNLEITIDWLKNWKTRNQ